jgi:hypothetical protein
MDSSNVYLFHVLFPYVSFCYFAKSLPDIYQYTVPCYYKRSIQQEKILVTSKFDLNLRKKLVKCYSWSITFYKAVTWTLQKLNQKYLERFEMWRWRRSFGPIVRETKKYLHGANKEKNILRTINRKMFKWFATSCVETAL